MSCKPRDPLLDPRIYGAGPRGPEDVKKDNTTTDDDRPSGQAQFDPDDCGGPSTITSR